MGTVLLLPPLLDQHDRTVYHSLMRVLEQESSPVSSLLAEQSPVSDRQPPERAPALAWGYSTSQGP